MTGLLLSSLRSEQVKCPCSCGVRRRTDESLTLAEGSQVLVASFSSFLVPHRLWDSRSTEGRTGNPFHGTSQRSFERNYSLAIRHPARPGVERRRQPLWFMRGKRGAEV